MLLIITKIVCSSFFFLLILSLAHVEMIQGGGGTMPNRLRILAQRNVRFRNNVRNDCAFVVRKGIANRSVYDVPFFSARRSALQTSDALSSEVIGNVAVIIVAGGKGKRMKTKQPKQLLPLLGKRVIEYSLELFMNMPEVTQVTVVIDKMYRPLLRHFENRQTTLKFADPGAERHDSVMNGLATVDYREFSLVAIHDAARPCITIESARRVFLDAQKYGAATLATPVKPTIKYSEDGEFVTRTLDRSKLWDVQTPQVATPEVLKQAYTYLQSLSKKELSSVTDDSSLIENIKLPVKVTKGEYTNLKITTMEDVGQAIQILESKHRKDTRSSLW